MMSVPTADSIEARPVPGYDGDYYLTETGVVISMKGDAPTVRETFAEHDEVNLCRNGRTTTYTRRSLFERTFDGDGAYSDAKLAVDLWCDYDLDVEAITEIVELSREAVAQVIEIFEASPDARERWRK
jgi:hypothetical protein